jgi:hypothetical protein
MSSSGRGTATISSTAGTWTVTLYIKDDKTAYLLGTGSPSNGVLVRQY